MTKEEALKMLKSAPRSDKPSRVNPSLSVSQSIDIVTTPIEKYPDGSILSDIFEKRVYQVCRNQRQPRYQ